MTLHFITYYTRLEFLFHHSVQDHSECYIISDKQNYNLKSIFLLNIDKYGSDYSVCQ